MIMIVVINITVTTSTGRPATHLDVDALGHDEQRRQVQVSQANGHDTRRLAPPRAHELSLALQHLVDIRPGISGWCLQLAAHDSAPRLGEQTELEHTDALRGTRIIQWSRSSHARSPTPG